MKKSFMNRRERFIEALTFGTPDKFPLSPGYPRESTLEVWRKQGLPENRYWYDVLLEELGIQQENPKMDDVHIGVSFKMIPEFEEKVLEHREGHYLVRDWMGATVEISDRYDVTYLRTAKDFVTRKWYSFPVKTHADWESMKERYQIDTPGRFPEDYEERVKQWRDRDYPLSVYINGPFWQLREWCGLENLCMFMLEEPDFVDEMATFWRTFIESLLERIVDQVQLDQVIISEDMAYKERSMISKKMAERFCKPCWQSWASILKQADCSIINVDSDGRIDLLIPIWIDAGVNTCNPIEVAAGNDIVAFRERFGKKMAYTGGIDKRAMAKGGAVLEQEIQRVVPPLLKDGGFIPSCDHGVPPDISWHNFKEYTRQLAELTGWL